MHQPSFGSSKLRQLETCNSWLRFWLTCVCMELRGSQLPLLRHGRSEVVQDSHACLVCWWRKGRVAELVRIGDNVLGRSRRLAIAEVFWHRMFVQQLLQCLGLLLNTAKFVEPQTSASRTTTFNSLILQEGQRLTLSSLRKPLMRASWCILSSLPA